MATFENVPDAFKYDPLKLYLYKKAIRKGKEKDRRLRINIIGNYAQGKTSLARRLAGLTCDGVTSTNGIEINRFQCKNSNDGRLEAVTDDGEYFIGRMALVANSMQSVAPKKLNEGGKDVSQSKETLTRITESPEKPKLSKESIEKKQFAISSEEFKTFSTKLDMTCKETEIYFDIWDFGGQYTFYATHTLFHSKKALYLLVFDLSTPLNTRVNDEEHPSGNSNKTLEYFAKFWIESIHSFVGPEPPVILVGTHRDKLPGNKQEQDKTSDLYFEQVRHIFDKTDMIYHILAEDFAVDNNDPRDTETGRLLHYLLGKGQELSNTDEIPARWIPLEKALLNKKQQRIIKYEDVLRIDSENEFPLNDNEEVKLFLQYQHEKGLLFYFDEEPISEYVVVEPRYLIDAFKCIVTPERFRLKQPSLRALWNELRMEAKLSNELLNAVWTKSPDRFIENKTVLLEFLKKHCIISPVVEFDEKSGEYKEHEWYIIPSLLQDTITESDMRDFIMGKSQTQIRYIMMFEKSTIVPVLFHRLLCAALGRWPVLNLGSNKLLFKNMGIFKLEGSYAGVAEMTFSHIELRTISLSNCPMKADVSESFRRYVGSVVQHEFRKLNYQMDKVRKPFIQQYRCNHEIHGLSGSHTVFNLDRLDEKGCIFCPDNFSHQYCSQKEAKAEWFIDESSNTVFPDKILTEKQLSQLAGLAIGKNWQLLGIELGVTQVEIDHIEEENSSIALRVYKMLHKWKARSASKATLNVLAQKMKYCKAVNIDWDEVRNIKDELDGTRKGDRIEFSQTLSDQVLEGNGDLFLECAITKPDAKVTWLKDGLEIKTTACVTECMNHHVHQLTLKNATVKDSGTYKCMFRNTYKCMFRDISTECFVNIYDRQTPVEFKQELTDQQIDDTNCIATFKCEINRNATDVRWFHNDDALSSSNKYIMTNEGPIHTLKIRSVVEGDEGKYCVVVDGRRSEAYLYFEDTEEERELFHQHLSEKLKKWAEMEKDGHITVENMTKGRCVRTLYYCEGDNPEELSFRPNEIISNVRPSKEPGWLEGFLKGRIGLIPENYVEYID
ncbi:uncharacterized protein LOC123556657 isoform X2 [Mercenaria mercenaria]|uniref:uncharacterized protein LOC123556657 isoform X2 n=1 Tax=Mercenaria mercenaria TaxID=6596 RepID=UPI00234F1200|nr:uncharacterized protein LOC123556657 isoform X2 [Mercenaria mercenaria]